MQWDLSNNRIQRPRLNSASGVEFDLSLLRRTSGPPMSAVSSYGMFRTMRRSCADIPPDNNHLKPPETQLYRSSSTSNIAPGKRRRSSDRSGSSEDAYFFVNNSSENLISVDTQKPVRYAFMDSTSTKGNLGKLEQAAGDAESLFRLKMGLAGTNAADGTPFQEQEHHHQGKTYKTASLFFTDGKREIDYILAYKDFRDDADAERKTVEQYIFEKNIKEAGLQIERVDKRYSKDGKTYFLKIHAPMDVLTRYADVLNIRMPIKSFEILSSQAWLDEQRNKNVGWLASWMSFFDYDSTLIPPEPDYFTAGFTRSKEDRFIIKHTDESYTSAQRSYIVYQILRRARFAKIDENDEDSNMKFGIRRLIGNGTYDAAYPLHDGPFDRDSPNGAKCERRVLYEQWARVRNWYKKQPLWVVRRYFGDQIGLYFTWLGFYTRMLMLPAILGLFTFLFGVCFIYSGESIPSQESCDSKVAGDFTMCPLCDQGCEYWKLKISCTFSKLTYLFDNPITVFFSIFMAFWATMFIELWKRKSAIVQWEWDLEGMEEEEETRPEFEAEVKTRRLNPVTQTMEPFLPRWKKILRLTAVYSIVLFLLTLVIASVFGIVVYRLTVVSVIHSLVSDDANSFFAKNAKSIASLTGAVLNLIIILIFNYLYTFVAASLTNMEYPRTQSEFEDSYTMKMFLFQFINYYSSLVYIAFFKGRFADNPGSIQARRSFTYDLCDPAGCLFELSIQLAIVMVGKQALNGIAEVMWPYLKRLWRRCTQREVHDEDFTSQHSTRWEEDYELETLDRMALFDEYIEMVIQYGFVTLFVAAFPLAPFFALVNNILEIRLDAFKYVSQFRRPYAKRAQDIGAWFGILKIITYLAVTCNAFVIAYTSDFIPRQVYGAVYSFDGSLRGFVNASLSVFDVNHFPDPKPNVPLNTTKPEFCRYRGLREPPSAWDWAANSFKSNALRNVTNIDHEYSLTTMYWHVFAARVVFVIVFEHLIFSLTYLLSSVIPDVPVDLKIQRQRESSAAREALFDGERQYFRERPHSRASSTSSNYGVEHIPVDKNHLAAGSRANSKPGSAVHHHSSFSKIHLPDPVGKSSSRDPSASPAFLVEEVDMNN